MQSRVGNLLEGFGQLLVPWGKEEEFDCSVFPFWKVKAIPYNCKAA